MTGMGAIFSKELARIFKDKKMIFSVFFLPVILMVGIMTLVGSLTDNMVDDIESHTSVVYIQNEPESFASYIKQGKYDYQITPIESQADGEKARDRMRDGQIDLIIEFPENFDEAIKDYQDGDEVPQIKTYYNPSEDYSAEAFNVISGQTLEAYRQILLSDRVGNLDQIAVFSVNTDNEQMVVQDDQKATGKMVGMMLPYFITILLFAGAMGIGTDMIAGEKERGTMASLLMTPIKRSSIALGKVFALMSLSGLSSVISVVAMVLCMPLMAGSMGGHGAADSLNFVMTATQIVMMGALLLAIAFLYSTIIALVSVFAKSTKEASSYVMPVYMLVLVVGLLTMFSAGTPPDSAYLIPIYNTALVLQGVFTGDVTMMQFGMALGVTVVISVVLIGVIVKAFESEKVMSA